MNLSVLERMAREGDMSLNALRYLVECRAECEWLDYKLELHLDNDKGIADFTKDIIAMKNVGGGYIVVGIQDKTWRVEGLKGPIPFDTKQLREKIRAGSGLELDVDIVHHEIFHLGKVALVGLIHVRASQKRHKRKVPSMVARDFCPKESFGLRRGDIYARRGDSTVKVASADELLDLLEALDAASDTDAAISNQQPSPFAIEDGTYRLLEKGFEIYVGRTQLRENVLKAVIRDPRIWIINVHGPGGVGKSALVNWATHEFYGDRTFEAIIQLTAKETLLTQSGIRTLTRSLYSLENLLEHILSTFQEPIPEDLGKQKALATELLSAWRTLLVLDNMETVSDGRILRFVQDLPPETKAKVLITSRMKTGGWELPIGVNELDLDEVKEFVTIRSGEMKLDFPRDTETCTRVWQASGGLPLAIQWIMGQFRLTGKLDDALEAVGRQDSPVLEFTFRNIWEKLSSDSRAILAVMTIFSDSPTIQNLAIATEWAMDRIERALSQLEEVTLVTRTVQHSDGKVIFTALPITMSFAKHQLAQMNGFEMQCRQRINKFSEQMQLHESELYQFRSTFDRYGLTSDNEKRAAILCRRGESEMFAGNVENADMLFKQARELAPQSAYVLALNASYEMARNQIGAALDYANHACRRANKLTGALCYTIKARIHDIQHDKRARVEALEKALEYDPSDVILRHQYGVALSRHGRPADAVVQFTSIIEEEKRRDPPRETLLMALKTRILNLERLGEKDSARKDREFAKEILADHPHLVGSTVYFDFDED